LLDLVGVRDDCAQALRAEKAHEEATEGDLGCVAAGRDAAEFAVAARRARDVIVIEALHEPDRLQVAPVPCVGIDVLVGQRRIVHLQTVVCHDKAIQVDDHPLVSQQQVDRLASGKPCAGRDGAAVQGENVSGQHRGLIAAHGIARVLRDNAPAFGVVQGERGIPARDQRP
jgi:hypothetical protein